MEGKTNEVYIEVYSILNLLGQEYINKLPSTLYEMIEKNVIDTKKRKYTSLSEINETNILKDSISMIALFHYNYWCEFQEEKNELKLLLKNNSIDNENKKREKYNPDNIFEKNNFTNKNINNTSEEQTNMYQGNIENTNVPVIIEKQSYINKIINFFLKFFNKSK